MTNAFFFKAVCFILCVCVCLTGRMCTACIQGLKSSERALDPLQLKLQVVVSHVVCARALYKDSEVLFTPEPSLQLNV